MKIIISCLLSILAVSFMSAQNLWVTLATENTPLGSENWSNVKSIEFKPIDDGFTYNMVMHTSDGVDVRREFNNNNFLYITDLTSELNALEALYKALGGDNWANNTNWCSDKHPSEWYGIECVDGHISFISMENNNLKGVLPEEIGDLKYLQTLYFPSTYSPIRNVITGPLPESIGKLTNLTHLNLIQNRISGKIPASIGNLKKLQTLNIKGDQNFETGELYPDDNYLTGEIPSELFTLKELWNLNLSANKLSGTLPSSLKDIPFRTFYLEGNQLTGPIPELNYNYCYSVRLALNKFSSLPPNLIEALDNTELNELWISKNDISATLSSEIVAHKRFPAFAPLLLDAQHDGYAIDLPDGTLPAVRYSYPLLDGKGSINLDEEYPKHEYTVLFRWAEWCPSSKDVTPLMTELKKRYADSDVSFIGAYGGGEESARRQFMSEYGLDEWTHFRELKNDNVFSVSDDTPLWRNWLGYGTPFVEVVDRKGNIVFFTDREGYYSRLPMAHKTLNEIEPFLESVLGSGVKPYESIDYSADGTVEILQEAASGNGIDIIFLGDGFSDRLVADGTYKNAVTTAMEAFFSEEPYAAYRDRFNVHMVNAVSKSEGYHSSSETTFEGFFGDGTTAGGNDEKCFSYALKAINASRMDDATIIVLMNSARNAGTCYMYYPEVNDEHIWGAGAAVAYVPIKTLDETFKDVLRHEAGGHGFAKLGDEYFYDYMGEIPQDVKTATQWQMDEYHWWSNVDFTDDRTQVKWKEYLDDNRYENEPLGVFEGGLTYPTGVWRPTEGSIMRYNTGGFNAPSREAIYRRIQGLTQGPGWTFDHEEFVEQDLKNVSRKAVKDNRKRVAKIKEQPRHTPPVVIPHSWNSIDK